MAKKLKKQRGNKLQIWLRQKRDAIHWRWVRFYESPFGELATLVGTVVGSALISASGGMGNLWLLMIIGAGIIAAGLAPSWARSASINRGLGRDALLDARADVADAYVRRALGEASDLVNMPRAGRVERAALEVESVVDDIWKRFYSGSEAVRVVYYVVSDDATKLELSATTGREGDARSFDASVDVRGQLGLDRLDIDELFEFHQNVNDLPDDWGSKDRGYVSFISIPVRVGSQGYGLISVDSSVEGELDERDGESLAVYASALGFYFASADRGRHGRNTGGGSDD